MENAHKCPADLLVQPIPYHSLPRETQFSLEPRPSEGVEVSGLPITLRAHLSILRSYLCDSICVHEIKVRNGVNFIHTDLSRVVLNVL
jgi:hypothetical protein